MSLLEQVQKDSLQARRSGNTVAKNLLVTLYSEIANISKAPGRDSSLVSDAKALAVIKKFAKNVEETLRLVTDDARTAVAQEELALLKCYMPELMAESELRTVIESIIAADDLAGPKAMGAVMARLKDLHAGLYDARQASEITKSLLV